LVRHADHDEESRTIVALLIWILERYRALWDPTETEDPEMLNVSLTVKVVVLIEAVVPAKLMVLLTVWVLASEVNVPLDRDSDVDCNVVPLRIVVEAVMSSVDAVKAASLHSSRESPDMVRPPGRLNVPFKALSVDCEARLVALVTVRLLPSPTSTCPDA